MSIVTLSDIHVCFGPEIVLDKLDLQLHPNEKVGMVGANGTGKSTIFKLITSQITPDMGKVNKAKSLRIGYLPQEAVFSGERTVLEEMHAGVEQIVKLQKQIHDVTHEMEHLHSSELKAKMTQYDRLCHDFEAAGGYAYETRIQTTLAGLGFEAELHHAKTSALSGGQLSRLGLAQVLMLDADLLLLDEPTNHLDIQATEWLEKFLIDFSGAAVIISHDRHLLDKTTCKIIEVEKRKAKAWKGNYSTYVQTKETLKLQQQREHVRRVEMVERTRDFIARNKDQEGMRKTARGRKRQLNRLLKENPDFLDTPTEQKTINFSFGPNESGSDLILRCENLGKSFGDLTLFENLTFDILKGERLGITGPNGTGKSTFLRLALGQVEPSGGTIRMGKNLRTGYLDQHGDVLNPDRTVLDEAWSVNPELSSEKIRNRLGAFLFSGDDVFKLCGELSGGQKNRLMLCKLVLSAPDVLVMDEPTNHLDIASREMLENALDDYSGTMIVVSHDRYFLDRIIDKLIVIGTDEFGNRCLGRTEFINIQPVYSYYASLVRQRCEAQQQKQKTVSSGSTKRRPSSAEKQQRQKMPEQLKRFNKYSVDKIEEMITALEYELVQMRERFGDENIYKNPVQFTALQNEYNSKTAELDLLYQAYEHRAG
ncbi:MAG: ABC-F family ATP-binding cassette domain-containing protein [Sedimentisphaerales bacterium]|nr:ABC-F family ATP-binding cassette domain-containing protein [Sedimentisphaerales bacterium]